MHSGLRAETCASPLSVRRRTCTTGCQGVGLLAGTLPLTVLKAMERLVRLTVAATCIGIATPAAAHPVPFSFLDVRIQPGSLEITVVAHIFDLGHDLGVEPPQRLLEPAGLSSHADAIAALVRTRLHLAADGE